MSISAHTPSLPSGLFHPAVAEWFESTLGTPTAPQVRAWPAIKANQPTLIAAPTGSGKTLSAFLSALDDLVLEGLREGALPDELRVLYISPLKALSNDIERNLEAPLAGIRQRLAAQGLPDVDIRTAVRTGDTPQSKRQSMVRKPPHILVTTPESLYILLTSASGREMLKSVRTVIVDEIHALVADKRGTHLALSLERLERIATGPLQRIGLSATQKPIETVADFLFGDRPRTIVDLGHQRHLDLEIEIPDSPLEAVMANEVWEEIYDRLAALIEEHSTTLVFVNTRRLAERLARHLSQRLGKDALTSHHGSLSKEARLDAEKRLKKGSLKALVATASLELGIDIGSVDLVCQIGSTRRIASLLQRVGRSGHAVGATPKGRLFPLTRDELVDSVATLEAIRLGTLDRLLVPQQPLDILAQQIVAEVAAEECTDQELFDLCRSAWPYRNLDRSEFDRIVAMLRDGFTTRNGRRGAYLHHDQIGGRLRPRRGARLAALTNGGAIPDTADYDVLLEPGEIRVGSVNEDFAVESMPGNIFQLGNTSWRILKIEPGKVRVEDGRGQPPTIPFWFGEAPARSEELSEAVSRLREKVARRAVDHRDGAVTWLIQEHSLPQAPAEQLVDYLLAAVRTLGAIPTRQRIIMERFFDEAGSMHVVVHSPLGSRLNRAWGLALRKRFCRKFNFELQAAATEDAIILSLGPTHSFPLEEVFTYLHPETVRDVLTQALLDSPMFNVRWRWNAGRALAILRFRGGRRVPPQFQRMNADDLVSVVFPDQLACLENIQGEREIPDHPLVDQTVRDCLEEAMDIDGLIALLSDMRDGKIEMIARDLTEPSPLAAEILTARPYAFLDDAPLEERRTQAVMSRRWLDPEQASDLGALDLAAIARVREESWPEARDQDEVHDALLLAGFLADREIDDSWRPWLRNLEDAGRLTQLDSATGRLWVAAERLAEMQTLLPESQQHPRLSLPPALDHTATVEDALREVLRGRLEILGPVTETHLFESLRAPDGSQGVSLAQVQAALAELEQEGFAMRGHFTPRTRSVDRSVEWCERRLLARIHRYTLKRLRAAIQPVSRSAYLRFLLDWQHVTPGEHKAGERGLEDVVHQLEGFELPAASWEEEILPQRIEGYDPGWLDSLCLAGKTQWRRRSTSAHQGGSRPGPIRSTPIALVQRRNAALWRRNPESDSSTAMSPAAQRVFELLQGQGATFFDDLASQSGLLNTQLESVIAELVSLGRATADSFLGLRALLLPAARKKSSASRRRTATYGLEDAGRWTAIAGPETARLEVQDGARPATASAPFAAAYRPEEAEELEALAHILLRRWGVVFRAILERETGLPPWRDVLRALRRLEARGEIRGGRFVNGPSGEQFALPEAIPALRKRREPEGPEQWISISAADPLNLVGMLTPGKRVPAITGNRILLRDGTPVACTIGGAVNWLEELPIDQRWQAEKELHRRRPASLLEEEVDVPGEQSSEAALPLASRRR